MSGELRRNQICEWVPTAIRSGAIAIPMGCSKPWISEGELVSLDLADDQFPGLIRRDQERRLQLVRIGDEVGGVLVVDRPGADSAAGRLDRSFAGSVDPVSSCGLTSVLLFHDARAPEGSDRPDGSFSELRGSAIRSGMA